MTTEDDFQAALDAHPDDWQTRLVFADWLQDRGDLRAEGYRALGANQRVPDTRSTLLFRYTSAPAISFGIDPQHKYVLPLDWYKLADSDWDKSACGPFYKVTRRAAEDTAALAFARLPAARRAELLTAGLQT